MRFFKQLSEGYISSIGQGPGGQEITEAEYGETLAVIRVKPPGTNTTEYRLREDLTWEAYEVEPPEDDPEEEVTAEEITAAIEEAMA